MTAWRLGLVDVVMWWCLSIMMYSNDDVVTMKGRCSSASELAHHGAWHDALSGAPRKVQRIDRIAVMTGVHQESRDGVFLNHEVVVRMAIVHTGHCGCVFFCDNDTTVALQQRVGCSRSVRKSGCSVRSGLFSLLFDHGVDRIVNDHSVVDALRAVLGSSAAHGSVQSIVSLYEKERVAVVQCCGVVIFVVMAAEVVSALFKQNEKV